MRLRQPKLSDIPFLRECYLAWTPGFYVTEAKVERWVERWMSRNDEIALIGIEGSPVGVVHYGFRRAGSGEPMPGGEIFVYNLLVHPSMRGGGYGSAMLRALRAIVVPFGCVAAEFDTLPGVIRDQLGSKYLDLGNGKGRITWDMEI